MTMDSQITFECESCKRNTSNKCWMHKQWQAPDTYFQNCPNCGVIRESYIWKYCPDCGYKFR